MEHLTTLTPIGKLVDSQARERFCTEIDTNFSVIAPAGVGKTTAIVGRILTYASSDNASLACLEKLVVVTYTKKAAEEMQSRARLEILKKRLPPYVLSSFNKAFFGTIHSFCLYLIEHYGFLINLPLQLKLCTDEEALWGQFLEQNSQIFQSFPKKVTQKLKQCVELHKILPLIKKFTPSSTTSPHTPLESLPILDFNPILNFEPEKPTAKFTQAQNVFKNWVQDFNSHCLQIGFPKIELGGKEFNEICATGLKPLWEWLGHNTLCFIAKLSQAYQAFRLQKGLLNYEDMIGLAERLLNNAKIQAGIQENQFRILLDEAQDTDKRQFHILLKSAFKANESDECFSPAPGAFCMVGDPQQAIYSSRADLPTYLSLHNKLVENGTAEALTFSVTMRCDKAIVDSVNALFPSILSQLKSQSQVPFVPLSPRPWAEQGHVHKYTLPLPPSLATEKKLTTPRLEALEAEQVASLLQSIDFETLGLQGWHQVACLCPRKSWLGALRQALLKKRILTQIHSHDAIEGDDPTFAWITALLTVIASPTNSFELVGVLREIFGYCDDSIAHYIHDQKKKTQLHPINLLTPSTDAHPIAQTLRTLSHLRKEVLELSLAECIPFLFEFLHLKDRLVVCNCSLCAIQNSLHSLSLQATCAETEGLTLAQFAHKLKKQFYCILPEATPKENHIQLFSAHKAKGLEWKLVVVPFLFRPIRFPSPSYPQLFEQTHLSAHLAITDHPHKKKWQEALDQVRLAELERLLYVTLTRAQNNLLFIDDSALFPNAKSSTPSFASLLQCLPEQPNYSYWQSIPNLTISKDRPILSPTPSSVKNPPSSPLPFSLSKAQGASAPFLKKLTPSSLTNYKAKQQYSLPQQDGLPYGQWWHKLFESFPWAQPQASWSAYLKQSLYSIQSELFYQRAKQEIDLFLSAKLFKQLVADPCLVIHSELPCHFLKKAHAFEGYIDLLVFSPKLQSFLLVDWKTDSISDENELPCLIETYQPQLLAYKDAVCQAYGLPVSTALYSTPLGKTIYL